MNKTVVATIVDEVVEFMKVDIENEDPAVGRFLHLKVRLDITKPLMRGITI